MACWCFKFVWLVTPTENRMYEWDCIQLKHSRSIRWTLFRAKWQHCGLHPGCQMNICHTNQMFQIGLGVGGEGQRPITSSFFNCIQIWYCIQYQAFTFCMQNDFGLCKMIQNDSLFSSRNPLVNQKKRSIKSGLLPQNLIDCCLLFQKISCSNAENRFAELWNKRKKKNTFTLYSLSRARMLTY